MTPIPSPAQALQNRTGAKIFPVGWPSYRAMRGQPESMRWQLYEFSKRLRAEMERHGCMFAESYDQFVQRVTAELEV